MRLVHAHMCREHNQDPSKEPKGNSTGIAHWECAGVSYSCDTRGWGAPSHDMWKSRPRGRYVASCRGASSHWSRLHCWHFCVTKKVIDNDAGQQHKCLRLEDAMRAVQGYRCNGPRSQGKFRNGERYLSSGKKQKGFKTTHPDNLL